MSLSDVHISTYFMNKAHFGCEIKRIEKQEGDQLRNINEALILIKLVLGKNPKDLSS